MGKKKGNQQRLEPKKKKKGGLKIEDANNLAGALNAGPSIKKRK